MTASAWISRLLMAASLGAVAIPAAANVSASQHLQAGLQSTGDQGLVGFYRARANRPLWTADAAVTPAARALIDILRRAPLDGMTDGEALASRVDAAVAKAASGRADDLAAAELLLSRAWVDYVRTLRRPVDVGMVYANGAHSPAAPFSAQILSAAGDAADLAAHLRQVSDLNPVYSQLRAGLANWRDGKAPRSVGGLTAREVEHKLRLNLDRARALPLAEDGSFILVDAASARMFLYRDGRLRDTMRVVVGKSAEATPMVAGSIQNAILNPYWNVPPDLVRKRAAKVLKDGVASLGKNFQLLSDWSENPRILDAKSVDWAAVAAGAKELRMRQLPGVGNAMGAMKFTFPNELGIYLHDTPDKSIFAQADRRLSSGCVRVEDARRLATWLFGRVPSARSNAPEQVVALPKAMPIFVTYLTAVWDGERIAFSPDGYGRDAAAVRMAAAGAAAPRAAMNR